MQSEQFELHARIEQRHWWFVARRRIMRRIVERLFKPDGRTTVVDVGCGTGANIAALADGYRCVGIDTSQEAVDLAARRFPDVQFLCGQAPDDLGDVAESARLFLLMDVLEHVSDDFELLSTLLAAATPGSNFLITVPAHLALWSPHDEAFGHYRRYDLQRLAAVWRGLPVSVRLCSYYNARLYPAVRAVRAVNRLLRRSSGADGTDFNLPAPAVNQFLERTFAGEADTLLNVLEGKRSRGYRTGVSLMAVLQREPGKIKVRGKPDSVAPDVYNPQQRMPECSQLAPTS
jgi:SAM-dependent methyltransferase